MNDQRLTLGPLERGLRLLAIVASAGTPLSFTALIERMGGINRATLSKMLKVLTADGYLRQVSGKYACGEALVVFQNADIPDTGQLLIDRYASLMETLSQTFRVSTILFKCLGNHVVSIHKVLHEIAPCMQDIGSINSAGSTSPWSLLLCLEQGGTLSREEQNFYAVINDRCIQENGQVFPGISRLALPIRDENNELTGILGVGAQTNILNNQTTAELVDQAHCGIEKSIER